MTREVNRRVVAAHALVNDGTSGGGASVLDGDGLAAVAVLHDALRQGEDVLRVTIVGGSAAAGGGLRGGSVVEGNFTRAGRALGAGTLVARAGRVRAARRRAGVAWRARVVWWVGSRCSGGLGLRGRSNSGRLRRRRRSDGGGRSWRRVVGLLSRRRDGSGSRRDSRCSSRLSGGGLGGLVVGSCAHSWLDASDRNGGSPGSVVLGVDGSGDIHGGPLDVGDGLPHDDVLAFVDRQSGANSRKKGTSKGQRFGDRSHC